jgi:hypothetical protein
LTEQLVEAGFIITIAIVVVAAVIAIQMFAASRRRKELAAYARQKGLSFCAEKDRAMKDRYAEFKCLRRGHGQYAVNVMAGELQGLPVNAFDYRYVTGSGKNRRVHRFSALIAKSPVSLKPLLIRREHAFDKLTEFFGLDDIDFESAEFSRRFFVKSPDKRWAYDVIHQRMMEYLLAAPEYSIQFDSESVIAWRSRRFSTSDFDEAYGLIKGILDRLPGYLHRP